MRGIGVVIGVALVLVLSMPIAAQDGDTGALLGALADIRTVESYRLDENVAEIVLEVDAEADAESVAEALLRVVLADAPDLAELSVLFRGGSDRMYVWNAEAGEWIKEAGDTPEPTAAAAPVLSFSSAEDGMQPVLGPIRLPTGVYIVEATTAGFFIGQIQTLSGACDTELIGPLFGLNAGQASDGAQTLLRSQNCEMLLAISNTQQPWTLTMQALDASPTRGTDEAFSSAADGMFAVLGPIAFDEGLYRVTVTTAGFFIGNLVTLEGSCDSQGFGPLFGLFAGQASAGAQATITAGNGCIAMLQTTNVTEPWTLEFEQLR